MPYNKDEIKIIQLGNIIFWHEEILQLINDERGISRSTEEHYKDIGFKPDFYSFHLAEVNEIRHKILAFTSFINQSNMRIQTKVEILINTISQTAQNLLEITIGEYINDTISRSLDAPEKFNQTSLGLALLDVRNNFINSLY